MTPYTPKLQVSGSGLTPYRDGSGVAGLFVTDTAITGNLRCGIHGQYNAADGAATTEQDNFQAADLSAGGILYTQLEKGLRGGHRGEYMEF